MTNLHARSRSHNLILDSLPPEDCDYLWPNLQRVELQQGEIIHPYQSPVTEVYFPTVGVLSLINSTAEGDTVEIGVTGNEGVAGVPLFLGQTRTLYQVEVQIMGSALKLKAGIFLEALNRSAILRQRLAAFTYSKMLQISQSAVCNRFHGVEERLCRWLLIAQDRTKSPELLLTRDILAQMIGARRPAVSLVTGALQTAGLIRAERGRITILNREEMEASSCECYRIVGQELDRYIHQMPTAQDFTT